MLKLLLCSLTLTALVAGHPAPGYYLIETEGEDLKLPVHIQYNTGDARDVPAEMEQAVEKESKDGIDGEETDGKTIDKGKEGKRKDYFDDDYCPDGCHDAPSYEAPGTFW